MNWLKVLIILSIHQNLAASEKSLEYKLGHFDKKVPKSFVFEIKDKVTFSKNCYENKKICLAKKRYKTPKNTEKFKQKNPNIDVSAMTCENNLKGEVLYYKSESNTIEGFCYFKEDNSAVSLPTIRNKYKDNYIER